MSSPSRFIGEAEFHFLFGRSILCILVFHFEQSVLAFQTLSGHVIWHQGSVVFDHLTFTVISFEQKEDCLRVQLADGNQALAKIKLASARMSERSTYILWVRLTASVCNIFGYSNIVE
jgi:hypothetical protein